MKPLLLDILACPICKFFPLKLHILNWETSESRFSKILEAFHKNDLEYLKKATKIRRGKDRIEDGVIKSQNEVVSIKDEMVRKKTDIINYLEEVEKKLENFQVMDDYSDDKFSSCLNLIKNEVIKRILDAKAKTSNKKITEIPIKVQTQILNDIISEIYLLNWFFQFSEIDEGVIFCEKCNRWYPIIETIPQMLPDDLREKEEINFLKKWKSKLPNTITANGKPFNLKTK